MVNEFEIAQTVDASGLSCPMPIIRARKGMDGLEGGRVLELVATDKGSLKDVHEWVKIAGHELLDTVQDGSQFRYYIRKKAN